MRTIFFWMAFVLSVFVSIFLYRNSGLQIGIIGEKNQGAHIGFVYEDAQGKEIVCNCKSFDSGSIGFWLPKRAGKFYFTFKTGNETVRIKGITVFAFRLLSPEWLVEGVGRNDEFDYRIETQEGCVSLDVSAKGQADMKLSCGKAGSYLTYAQQIIALCLAIAPWIIWGCVLSFVKRKQIAKLFHKVSFPKPVFIALMAIAFVTSIPLPVVQVTDGLDPSWVWLINKFALSQSFGSEFVFTYGPLGFLLFPQMVCSHVAAALVFNVIYFVLQGLLATKFYRMSHAAGFLVLSAMFFPHSNLEWNWVLLPVLSVAFFMYRDMHLKNEHETLSDYVTMLAFPAMLSPILMCCKFSMLVPVCGSHVVMIGSMLLMSRTNRVRIIAWYVLPFLISFLTLYLCIWGSPESFLNWFGESLEIARGYNECMMTYKGCFELSLPFAVLALFAVAVGRKMLCGRKGLLIVLWLSPVLFTTLKYAICRQGISPLCFTVTGCLALMVMTCSHLRRRCLFLFCVLFVATLPRALIIEMLPLNSYYKGFADTVMLPKTFDEVASKRPESRIPQEWKKLLTGKRVQEFPVEQGDLMSLTDIEIVPMHCLQMYSAYTPKLDEVSARHYANNSAPDYVICDKSNRDIDGRYFTLDNPRVFECIRNNYDLADESESLSLLKKRTSQRVPSVGTNVVSSTTHVGEWIEVPPDAGHFAIEWHQGVSGRLTTLFLRNAITYVTAEYDDGSAHDIRILPANMNHPIPLHESFDAELSALWKPSGVKKVKRIKFYASTGFMYENELKLKFYLCNQAPGYGRLRLK